MNSCTSLAFRSNCPALLGAGLGLGLGLGSGDMGVGVERSDLADLTLTLTLNLNPNPNPNLADHGPLGSVHVEAPPDHWWVRGCHLEI